MHAASTTTQDMTVAALERDGIVPIDGLLAPEALRAMQEAYRRVLGHINWSTTEGFQQTDPFRRMVENILTLDPAFQALALNPRLQEILRQYLGSDYVLTEVKGWETVATRADFHGWHNDAWYDHKLPEVPREVKLGVYLTDVQTGHFTYIKGTHVNNRHRHWNDREVAGLRDQTVDMKGPAGSTFLFDTAGIHRQSSPCLKPRWVVMYNYHDIRVPLQEIDVSAYRYHPLILNAAFLGGLSAEQQRILGFGNRSQYQGEHTTEVRHPRLQATITWFYQRYLTAEHGVEQVREALRTMRRRLGGGG
jgi:hypothetical protein